MKKGKSNFFLIAPFALWGCISVWTSNLVRLTDKSAVPMLGLLCFSHMES